MRAVAFLFAALVSFPAAASRCAPEQAAIFFPNPAAVEEIYRDTDYYCSDILYLQNARLGPVPLAQYEALYLGAANVSRMRSLGITPDIIRYGADPDDPEATAEFVAEVGADPQGYIDQQAAAVRMDVDYKVEYGAAVARISNDRSQDCLAVRPSGGARSFSDIARGLPPAMRPVAVSGGVLLSPFDRTDEPPTIARIDYSNSLSVAGKDATKSSLRNIVFHKLPSNISVEAEWSERNCRSDGLVRLLERQSRCSLCRYLVFFTNEISYLFDYVFRTFRYVLLAFLALGGAFAMAGRFLKGFDGFPWANKFDGYLKDVGEKMRVVVIASVIAVLPPKVIFSFTLEPVLDLTLGLADRILAIQGLESRSCDADRVIGDLQKAEDERRHEKIVPPVVARWVDRAADEGAASEAAAGGMAARAGAGGGDATGVETAGDGNSLFSPSTVGTIVCFMQATSAMNAKGMVLGQVFSGHLGRLVFKNGPGKGIVAWVVGIMIYIFFWWINLMIGFYILDAFYEVLLIAITWPFRVFGYAFGFIEFGLSDIMTAAKDIGVTFVSLAVFGVYNMMMMTAFRFVGGTGGKFDAAVRANDVNVLLDSVMASPGDTAAFLFILFVMWYFYSNMDRLLGAFDGKVGQRPLGSVIKALIVSGATMVISGKPAGGGDKRNYDYYVNGKKKKDGEETAP
ncbi:MAG: hypothetical protein LBT92_02425 [Rickettsiales bacterium]|jgi:hypothetical protein|nr:hypothetical protein [Rickettsiales bacterium]